MLKQLRYIQTDTLLKVLVQPLTTCVLVKLIDTLATNEFKDKILQKVHYIRCTMLAEIELSSVTKILPVTRFISTMNPPTNIISNWIE